VNQELAKRLLEAVARHQDGSGELGAALALEWARLQPFERQTVRNIEITLDRPPEGFSKAARVALLHSLGTARLIVGGDHHSALAQALATGGGDPERSPPSVATLRALSSSDQSQGRLEQALASVKRVLYATDSSYWGTPILLGLERQRRDALANDLGKPVESGRDAGTNPLGFDGLFRSVDDLKLTLPTGQGMGPVALQHGTRFLREAGRADLAAAAARYSIASAIARKEGPFTVAFYHSVFGQLLFQDGDFAGAESELAAAVDFMTAPGAMSIDAGGLQQVCSYLVTSERLQDQLAKAEAAAERCKRVLDRSKECRRLLGCQVPPVSGRCPRR
jgi:hypothetical protein